MSIRQTVDLLESISTGNDLPCRDGTDSTMLRRLLYAHQRSFRADAFVFPSPVFWAMEPKHNTVNPGSSDAEGCEVPGRGGHAWRPNALSIFASRATPTSGARAFAQ